MCWIVSSCVSPDCMQHGSILTMLKCWQHTIHSVFPNSAVCSVIPKIKYQATSTSENYLDSRKAPTVVLSDFTFLGKNLTSYKRLFQLYKNNLSPKMCIIPTACILFKDANGKLQNHRNHIPCSIIVRSTLKSTVSNSKCYKMGFMLHANVLLDPYNTFSQLKPP